MATIDINGEQVHIEGDDDSVKDAIKYLEEKKDNATAYFLAAHQNHDTGVAHFEIPNVGGYNGSHHFTLIHNNDGSYELRRRHGY